MICKNFIINEDEYINKRWERQWNENCVKFQMFSSQANNNCLLCGCTPCKQICSLFREFFFFFFGFIWWREKENKPHAFYFAKMKISNEKVSDFFWRHVFGLDHKCETIINANWTYDDDCSFSLCVCQTMSPKPHFRSLHVSVCYDVFSGLPMNKLLPIIKLQINGCDDIKQSVLT